MDTKDVANHLTNALRENCPGLQRHYSLSYIEYMLTRELDVIAEEFAANDNEQGILF